MKGKVACQMGMNELLITELITQNVLGDLKPAEVAALLSTMVFQVRSRNKEDLEDVLKDLEPPLQKVGYWTNIFKLIQMIKFNSQ